jgi:cytidine deaminase
MSNSRTEVDWDALRTAARARLVHAHAPYSGFHVAAAVCSASGDVFVGVNVENASFGLTVCAERNAIAAAVAAGARSLLGMVVVSSGTLATPPCGACRQVLCEFPPAFPLRCYASDDSMLETQSDALLPHAFGPGHFAR